MKNSKFEKTCQDIISKTPTLIPKWCDDSKEGEDCEFHSYPKDGECSCGLYKHHVHCQHGGIIQVG